MTLAAPSGTPPDPPSLLDIAFADAVGGADRDDEMTARLLDAAFEQFCRMGITRCSVGDVAHRAGVSRITVYRRFATKGELVQQVVRREFRRYFDQFIADIRDAPTLTDRVALGFVSSMRAIRGNRLIGALMAAEPESVVLSMTGDGGRTLSMVRQFLAGRLRQEQRAGHVADSVDVAVVAEMMVRVSASLLVIPSHVIDLSDETQLAALARTHLAPMLNPPPQHHPSDRTSLNEAPPQPR
ncbi:TetR/AcrR family transcriptional regulator [Streptomyces sp. NPDC090106]|uniref:TetR/AcrR family transcriptional regulator n=1 Tax=Streptomyces sp. NPDC090106 TaxID=3365946 RepID=UPI003810CC24